MNKGIDEYIAQQEPWKQEVLKDVRTIIHNTDPEIEETLKWGTPTFEDHGIVVWTFCAKEWVHVSFPQGVLLDAPAGTWTEEAETTTKAQRTLKFRQGDVVPESLLAGLVTQAVKNNREGKKFDFKIAKPGENTFDVPHEYEAFLREHGVLEEYLNRPYYQQKGWIQWIEGAKQPETQEKRKLKMLEELHDGTYMPPKHPKE